MKKPILVVGAVLLTAALVWAGVFYWLHLRGAGPAFLPPPQDIAQLLEKGAAEPPEGRNLTDFPLTLPPGFTISVFAKDLGAPRVLALDPEGTLLASIPAQGRLVALPDRNRDGAADAVVTVIDGLTRPHGFIFHPTDPTKLYIAEVEQVAVYDYDATNLKARNPRKILDLPPGGRHWTRTMLWEKAPATGDAPAPGHRLLISVGSSCDTCVERDWRYATVLVADEDGKNLRTFATGLRNAVFMTRHPVTGQVLATEMGRDFLGDDLPPDEINIVKEGRHYGWPWCYGQQVHDAVFDPRGAQKAFCRETEPAHIDIVPAHSSPLGLAFIPATDAWPADYHHHLLVSYHGSWNRTIPTGYKVVRFRLDRQGNYLGVEDFISGWLTPDHRSLGRPVDIVIKPDGVMYISDDKAGVVYRLAFGE
jgi:glucose/arabinose dehydrogenase